jgi:hypothetical protein
LDRYDVFLSHASEDKDAIVRPLYAALDAIGVSVWFDEAVLELGDSLRRKIDDGLARCRYGVVILSPRFLEKQWPQHELDGLVARESVNGTAERIPAEGGNEAFNEPFFEALTNVVAHEPVRVAMRELTRHDPFRVGVQMLDSELRFWIDDP